MVKKQRQDISFDVPGADPIVRLVNMVLHEAVNGGHRSVQFIRLKDHIQVKYDGMERDAPPLRLWYELSACLWLYERCLDSSKLFKNVLCPSPGDEWWEVRLKSASKKSLRSALRLVTSRVSVALSHLA